MLNKQGKGKIDWTDWTLNPVSGCKTACEYCYMNRMESRFPGIMEPRFRPEYLDRLQHVRKVKPGDKIFIGSSGDMWGAWVDDRWISECLSAFEKRPEFVYQFLTKNPTRYDYFKRMDNAWYGTTVDGTQKTMLNAAKIANIPRLPIRFISFEPLIQFPDYRDFNAIASVDWIIIGANSNRGAEKPPLEFADRLIDTARNNNVPVWVKDNYNYPEVIKEFPNGNH